MNFHCMRLVKFMGFFCGPTNNSGDTKSQSLNNERRKKNNSMQNNRSTTQGVEKITYKQSSIHNKSSHITEGKKYVQNIESQNHTGQNLKPHKSGIKSVTIVCDKPTNKRTPQQIPLSNKKSISLLNIISQNDHSIRSRRRCRTLSLSSIKRSLTLQHFYRKRWCGRTDLTKINKNKHRSKRIETLFTSSKSYNNSSSSSNKLLSKWSKSSDRSNWCLDSKDSLFRKVKNNFPWVKRAPVCFVVNNYYHKRNGNCNNGDQCRFRVIDFPSKSGMKEKSAIKPKGKDYTKTESNPLQKMTYEDACKHNHNTRIAADKKERHSKESLRSCLRQTPQPIERESKHQFPTRIINDCVNKDSLLYNISSDRGDNSGIGPSPVEKVVNPHHPTYNYPLTDKEIFYRECLLPSYQRPQTTSISVGDTVQLKETEHLPEFICPDCLSHTQQKIQNVLNDVAEATQNTNELITHWNGDIAEHANILCNTLTKSECITSALKLAEDNKEHAVSCKATNHEITKHGAKMSCDNNDIAGKDKMKKSQCAKLKHDIFNTRTAHSSNDKCESHVCAEPALDGVSKCLLNHNCCYSTFWQKTGRRTIRQLLFNIVTLAWSPCILMLNIERCVSKSFHKKHRTNSIPRQDCQKDSRRNRNSVVTNLVQRIRRKSFNKRSKSDTHTNKNNIVSSVSHCNKKIEMGREWVLKPIRPNRLRRRRPNFRSIFQIHNFKTISKTILGNKTSSSTHACPSILKKTSGLNGKLSPSRPFSKHPVTQNNTKNMTIKNEEHSKVSFASSSQETHIYNRSSRPRMRQTNLIYRGDVSVSKPNSNTRSRSEPKGIPSASSFTPIKIKQLRNNADFITQTTSRLDCGDLAKTQTDKKVNKGSVICECAKANNCECTKVDSCVCAIVDSCACSHGKKSSSTTNATLKEKKRAADFVTSSSHNKFIENKNTVPLFKVSKNISSNNLKITDVKTKNEKIVSKRLECGQELARSIKKPIVRKIKKANKKSGTAKIEHKEKRAANRKSSTLLNSSVENKCACTPVSGSTKKTDKGKFSSSNISIRSEADLSQENKKLKKVKGAIQCNQSLHKPTLCGKVLCKSLDEMAKQDKNSVIIISKSRNRSLFTKIQSLLKKSSATNQCTNNKIDKKGDKKQKTACLAIDISKPSIKSSKQDTSVSKTQSDYGSSFSLKSASSRTGKRNQSLQCILMPKESNRDRSTDYIRPKTNKMSFKKLICRKRKKPYCSDIVNTQSKNGIKINLKLFPICTQRRNIKLNKSKSRKLLANNKPQQKSKYSQFSMSCCDILPNALVASKQPNGTIRKLKKIRSYSADTCATVEKISKTIKRMKCDCARKCHKRRRRNTVSISTQYAITGSKQNLAVQSGSITLKKQDYNFGYNTSYKSPSHTTIRSQCHTHRLQQCSSSLLSCAGCLQPKKIYPSCTRKYSVCTKPTHVCAKTSPICLKPPKSYPYCTSQHAICSKPAPACSKSPPVCSKSYPDCSKRNSICSKPCPVQKPCFTCPKRRRSTCMKLYPQCSIRQCRSSRIVRCPWGCKKMEKRKIWCMSNLRNQLLNIGITFIYNPLRCIINTVTETDREAWKGENDFSSCDSLSIKALRRKPYFCLFSCCPDCYPAFLAWRKSCIECARCVAFCLAGCIWIPFLAVCYYTCVGLCRCCSL